MNVQRSVVKCTFQAEIPTQMGVADDPETAMETDEIKKEPGKKYFIDTNSLRVPRKSTEIQSFLKDGMSKISIFIKLYNGVFSLKNTHNCLNQSYKNMAFPFQNNSKDLDLSYKTGLDFRDCFGRLKLNPITLVI